MRHASHGRFAWWTRLSGLALLCLLPGLAWPADLRVPATVEAGKAFSVPAEGSGDATFYLLGPDHVVKRTVSLGRDVQIQSADVQAAGRYQVILCGSSCTSATFEVKAAPPAHLSFFLHPSRVPVSTPDSVDATAFVFDPYFNLVFDPGLRGFPHHSGERCGVFTGEFGTQRRCLDAPELDSTRGAGPGDGGFGQRTRSASDSTGCSGSLRIAHESDDQREYGDSGDRSRARLQRQCPSRRHRRLIHQD